MNLKCESCKLREAETETPKNEGLENGIWDSGPLGNPYKLCPECRDRLQNFALRPLEFFNLAAIHGDSFHLHDDFYDRDTGKATQPQVPVIDAKKLPFPTFKEIKENLSRLIDYAFVQYYTEDRVLAQLQQHSKADLFDQLRQKVAYNPSINYKAYEIAAKTVGRDAETWAKEQWADRTDSDSILDYAELLCGCLDPDEAFQIITQELEATDDTSFYSHLSALLYPKSRKTLDWLETQTERIKNITEAFGQLAASSQFSWTRCDQWLSTGRPLSLIALDALHYCTLHDYISQSIWLQRLQPQLAGSPDTETITLRLQEYLETDNTPRTRNRIANILQNLSHPSTNTRKH